MVIHDGCLFNRCLDCNLTALSCVHVSKCQTNVVKSYLSYQHPSLSPQVLYNVPAPCRRIFLEQRFRFYIFFFFVTLLFCVLSESYQTYQTGPRLPTRDVAATWRCGPGFDSRTRASLCKAIHEHFLLFASKDMASALHCRCRNSLLAVCHCWMHHEPFLRWRYEEERRLWSIQHWGGMI